MHYTLGRRQAAIECGIIKVKRSKPKTKTIPIDSPAAAMTALLKVFSKDELLEALKQ